MAAITLKHINKEYGDGYAAVKDVSLDIGDGEFMILVGPSGCGKSTIANAILRLLRDPAVIAGGSIRFAGTDVLALSAEQLRDFRTCARRQVGWQNSDLK